MDTQTMDYNFTYSIPDGHKKLHPELYLDESYYRDACTRLISEIPIKDLKTIFRLSTNRYSTPMEYNCGTSYTVTIKI